MELSGDRGGGGVGVDVQPSALIVEGQRRDQRDDAGFAKVAEEVGVDARHFADAAQVDRLTVGPRKRQLLAKEHFQRAEVRTDRPAAQEANLLLKVRIDL